MNKQEYLERLIKKRESVFEIYNYDLLPNNFTAFDKIPIECYKHGVFYQKAGQHMFGTGCPTCGKLKSISNRTITSDKFIDKSRSKFGNTFIYSKTNYLKKGIDLTITCPNHGDFIIKPEEHLRLHYGCQKCEYEIPREISKDKLIEKAKKVHNYKYDYSKVKYINSSHKVEIICPKHGSFWQHLHAHVNQSINCIKCTREDDKLTLANFISRSKILHGDRYDYSKVEYLNNQSKVIITCREHGDFIQRAGSHLAGNRCKKCFIEESKLSTEQFINNAKKVHGDKYNYDKVKYIGNKKKIEITCSKHGSFWVTPNSHISEKTGCRFCMESKGEKAVEMCLRKYNIKYIREYKILPYPYRYDFYLYELDIYIEFNGLQHYKPIDIFGGMSSYLKTKENDNIKKTIIKENNGKLIVLTYLHLSNDSVEYELISRLKYIYKYWFLIEGKLHIFKNDIEVIEVFKLPITMPIRNMIKELRRIIQDFQVLF